MTPPRHVPAHTRRDRPNFGNPPRNGAARTARWRRRAAVLAALAVGTGTVSPAWAADPRPMALRDCIQEALTRNFDVQIERINPQIAVFNLRATYGDYDPTLNLNATHQYTSDAGGLDSQNRPYAGSTSDADTLSGGISGLAPWGMTYNLSANASDTYGFRPGTNPLDPLGALVPRPFENSRATWTVANLRQPLLRNAWIDSTRLNLRTRRHDLNASRYALVQTVQNTIAQVEQAYFDLVASLENVRNAEKSLELAERLYRENGRRVQIGMLSPLDEKEAQSQMASSRATLIAAQASVVLAQNQLKGLITDQYEKSEVPDIRPTEPLELAPPLLDPQQSRSLSLQMRPDLQQLVIELERRQLITRYQRNQLFPQLDITGNLGFTGNGNEFSDSLTQAGEGSAPFHSIGAVLSIPLSNRRARENYRISQSQREQAELQLRRLRQEILIQVDNSLQSAQSSFERVGATREARQFAEAALAAEEKKLANGKSTSFIVLQLQQRLTASRFEELRAQADYNKSLSTLRQREGTTLVHHRIDLPEAPVLDPKKLPSSTSSTTSPSPSPAPPKP